MAENKKIKSISEYIEILCTLNEQLNKYSPLHDAELLFRGQADCCYELIPGIGRNREFDCQRTIFNDERNLIEMAKYKLPEVFRGDMLPIELLALLQHHGIPTRLLDVTENALIALYFACCSEFDKDAEVIVFINKDKRITNYPIINGIADSYRFTDGTWTPLSSFYGNIKNQIYFLEQKRMQDILFQNDVEGGEWIAECCKKIMYIYAPVRSLRQKIQQGRYILFPNHINLNDDIYNEKTFGWTIDSISKEHEDIVGRIIIPKEIKEKLFVDLSILGIKKDVLFGDNIDIVCGEILGSFARKY